MRNAIVMAPAVFALLAASAYGQKVMQADIPFEFHVAGKVVPAGTYVADASEKFHWLRLQHAGAGAALFVSGRFENAAAASGRPAMVFHRYGDRHFLRSVDIPGRRACYKLPRSRAEREMVKAGRMMEIASIGVTFK